MTDIPEQYRSKTPEQAMAHLAEELSEACTAACKSLRFGFDAYNPELPPDERETNIEWLDREMQNVKRAWAALNEFLATEGKTDDNGEKRRSRAQDFSPLQGWL